MNKEIVEKILNDLGFQFAYKWEDNSYGYKKDVYYVIYADTSSNFQIGEYEDGFTEQNVKDSIRFEGIIETEELLTQTLNSILNIDYNGLKTEDTTCP